MASRGIITREAEMRTVAMRPAWMTPRIWP
jgi:hypothetical protein